MFCRLCLYMIFSSEEGIPEQLLTLWNHCALWNCGNCMCSWMHSRTQFSVWVFCFWAAIHGGCFYSVSNNLYPFLHPTPYETLLDSLLRLIKNRVAIALFPSLIPCLHVLLKLKAAVWMRQKHLELRLTFTHIYSTTSAAWYFHCTNLNSHHHDNRFFFPRYWETWRVCKLITCTSYWGQEQWLPPWSAVELSL